MINTTNIGNLTESDLGYFEASNFTGGVSYQGIPPEGLSGILGKITFGNYSFKFAEERLFIWNAWNAAKEFISEQWEYKNLPEGLDKYLLEGLLQDSGIMYWVKVLGDIYLVNATPEKLDFYGNPKTVRVNEPDSFIDGIETEYFAPIRNNMAKSSTIIRVARFIRGMERTLFQIEKNLTVAAPKGLLRIGKDSVESLTNNAVADSLEAFVNGEDTFAQIVIDNKDDPSWQDEVTSGEQKEVFIPIELKDRITELVSTFTTFKELYKEAMGAGNSLMTGRKERSLVGEIETQLALSDVAAQHMFNIRKTDLELANKRLGTNMQIIFNEKEEATNVYTQETTDSKT